MNLLKKYWIIFVFLLISGCFAEKTTTVYQPFPEGEQIQTPIPFIIHCFEFPDSIFCKDIE